ncbi:integrase/recombinase xerD homolog [Branchiostoma floridae x Branchiostoma belcheri]
MDAAGINQAFETHNRMILNAVSTMMDEKLGTLKRANEEMVEKQVNELKRMKKAEAPKIKKKAYQDQYDFSQKVKEKLEQAKAEVEAGKNDRALETLTEADVYNHGFWEDAAELKDSHLKELAGKLPAVAVASRAPGTVEQYRTAFNKWREFASRYTEVVAFPALPLHVALYLMELIQSSSSFSTVEKAAFGIRWAHLQAGLTSPTEEAVVKNVLNAAKRLLGKPVVKKEVITPDILAKIVQKYAHLDDLSNIRSLTLMLISYAGFLRYSEISNIKCCDISFSDNHASIFLQSSKTDQYRDGSLIPIARTGKETCPVNMLLRYCKVADIDFASDSFLLRGIIKTKSGSKLRSSGKLSYTRARELVLGMLKTVVSDVSRFGLHSLRAGGASAAANAGIPERLFKRHGRWMSDKAKDGYVKDKLQERLAVSMALGI